ncbi:hypothetical protein [Tsukamurella spumae]|uniref:Uncharacterized protein n=1 Tax=Tsukamurella spumae TaxID=44753 RepID=A0A846X679_9ACTN|nr:hypothetical protein [Tsukamurella spumae]NKY19819.1 hypothetical protein [Tsukamurella spumae]
MLGNVRAAVLALMVTALALTACSNTTEGGAQAPATASATASAAGSSTAQASAPAAAPVAPVPGAYVGAGGPRPADATPLPTYLVGGVRSAHLSSPSGGIKCDFQVASSDGFQGQCGVRSYATSSPYGCTPVDGGRGCKANWLFPFRNGLVEAITMTRGTTGWMNVTPSTGYTIPVIAYGRSVYFDDWVCASAFNGMTCWNTKTGSGVFMSNERSEKFTGPGASGAVQAPVQTSAAPPTQQEQGEAVVLGSLPSNGSGYGVVRPGAIDNGASITGRVTGISWSSWGGDRAEGRGTAYNAMGDVMGGAPETYPVQLVAFEIGTCDGKRAYRKLAVYKAGGTFNAASASDVCWTEK